MTAQVSEWKLDASGEWEWGRDEHGRDIARRPESWTRDRLWKRVLEASRLRAPMLWPAHMTPFQRGIYEKLAQGRCNAILHGPAQRGKTEVAVLASRQVLLSGASVEMHTWLAVKKHFEPPELDARNTTELEMFEAFRKPDVLFIDEVGYGNPSRPALRDHEHYVFHHLISFRHSQGRWTWITTNLPWDRLEALYGEPAISRLAMSPSVIADFSVVTEQFRYQTHASMRKEAHP